VTVQIAACRGEHIARIIPDNTWQLVHVSWGYVFRKLYRPRVLRRLTVFLDGMASPATEAQLNCVAAAAQAYGAVIGRMRFCSPCRLSAHGNRMTATALERNHLVGLSATSTTVGSCVHDWRHLLGSITRLGEDKNLYSIDEMSEDLVSNSFVGSKCISLCNQLSASPVHASICSQCLEMLELPELG
jgi:hypothetical protein